jgi:hypothetical protein
LGRGGGRGYECVPVNPALCDALDGRGVARCSLVQRARNDRSYRPCPSNLECHCCWSALMQDGHSILIPIIVRGDWGWVEAGRRLEFGEMVARANGACYNRVAGHQWHHVLDRHHQSSQPYHHRQLEGESRSHDASAGEHDKSLSLGKWVVMGNEPGAQSRQLFRQGRLGYQPPPSPTLGAAPEARKTPEMPKKPSPAQQT